MRTKMPAKTNTNEIPASLSPESLDRLADLVVAKLMAQNQRALPSKQVVAGSSPVSRSISLKTRLMRRVFSF